MTARLAMFTAFLTEIYSHRSRKYRYSLGVTEKDNPVNRRS